MLTLARIPLLLLFVATSAFAQTTTVPLNTGYDHGSFAPYPAATGNPTNVPDNYWTNIASYPPTNPPVGRSWVLQTPSAWAPPLAQSHWIAARNTYVSPAGISVQNPGYTIFRKCFCLLPNYRNPSISFQLRADNNVEVWLNSVLNKLLNQTIGNWWPASNVLASLPSQPQWFRVGRNCVYVLVEDDGGYTGFMMNGSVTATGLLPFVAVGDEEIPCCRQPRSAGTTALRVDEEKATIDAITKIAEERRKNRKQILRTPDKRR